jgi:hypothetical protein
MRPLRWIGDLLAYLWRFARGGWLGGDLGLRIGSGSAALYTFLVLVLFLVGLVLVLLGFDLGDVDRWLDSQGSWVEAVADLLFRAVCAGIVLICLFMIGSAVFARRNPDRPGLGCAFLALVVGYFAWFGMVGN